MTVHYVPAGAEAYADTRAHLFVRNQPNEKEYTEFAIKHKKWVTLERTVIEAATSNRGGIQVDEPYDVVVPIFNSTFIRDLGLTKVLANPEVGKNYDKRAFKAKGISSIIDSGGFQMLTGKSDFVDPSVVIERYNADADIGMALDLPMRAPHEPAYWDRVSHMTRANNDYIEPKLNKGIDMALVSHGTNWERRKSRLDILTQGKKPPNVIAIAGLGIVPHKGQDKQLAAIESLMYVVSRFHKTTDYFHVLGVTDKTNLFFYSLLDKSGYVKNIGADSVSHRLGALVGDYETMDFKKLQLTKGHPYRERPLCNCPVCTSIDDLRIIQSWRILECHNLYVWAKRTQLIGDIAEAYLKGGIKDQEVINLLQLPKVDATQFTVLTNYIREVMASKFKPLQKHSKTSTLFGQKAGGKIVKDDRIEGILKRYGDYHGKKF